LNNAGSEQYMISIPNISFDIPMDVVTAGTIRRMLLGPQPVQVSSPDMPVADPQNWYLKKMTDGASPHLHCYVIPDPFG
jgi:hypothetical protein